MFCYKCGNQLPDEAAFCNKCGTKIFSGETLQKTTNTGFESENIAASGITNEKTPSAMTHTQPSTQYTVEAKTAQSTSVALDEKEESKQSAALPQSDTISSQTQNLSEQQYQHDQNSFEQFVDYQVHAKTGYRSAIELLQSKGSTKFIIPCFAIPAGLILLIGIINHSDILMALILAALVSLLFGYLAARITCAIVKGKYANKYSAKFKGTIDTDDLIQFLDSHLEYLQPYFYNWGYITVSGINLTGALMANIGNSAAESMGEICIGTEFDLRQTLFSKIIIRPVTVNFDSGEMEYFFSAGGKLVGGKPFASCKCLVKTAPILQAAMEYYLKSRKGIKSLGGGSGQTSQASNASQLAIFKDSGDESTPVMMTENKSKVPIIVGVVIVAIVAVVVFFCIKKEDPDFFNNILPSAGNSNIALTKSLKDKNFSLNYPSDWNKISNPSALAELSSPDGMANFKVVECYYDTFGVFTGSEAQVKKEVNYLHTFVKLWDTKIDGTSAKALTYKTDGLKSDMVVNNYWYYVGDDMFQIICSYEESAKDSYEDVLGAMVGSFLIVGKSNAITAAVSEPVPITTTSSSGAKPNTPAQTTSTGTPNTPAQTTASKTEPIGSPPSHTESSKPAVTAKPSMVDVPYCDSCSESSAAEKLKDSGFNVKIEYEYDDYTNKGYTIYTEPSGGTRSEEGTTVILHISKGPQPVTVPNFVGLTEDEANTVAYKNNITITWHYEYSDYVDAGKIISQSISAGMEIEKYSTVILTVSQGVEDKTVEICGRNYSISSTESIYFWKASLTAADWDNIEKLDNLTELTLTECGGIDLNRIAKLNRLKKLSLCWDYISDISPLKNMTNLTSLELAGNDISDLSPLKNLTNLVSLGLSSNYDITDAEVSKILHLTGLTELDLGYTGIHDIKPIVALKNLKYFSFIGNNISQNDVLWFIEQLPDCQIDW